MGLEKKFFFLLVVGLVAAWRSQRTFGKVGGSRWSHKAFLEGHGPSTSELVAPESFLLDALAPGNGGVVDLTAKTLSVLGEYNEMQPINNNEDFETKRQRHAFNLRVGTAMEILRRELPLVFAATNLDFSIFAPQITVVDQRQNRVVMPKSVYMTAVKSLRMASAISNMFPCMNVKKIEYVEDERTIQVLVDVVLPDAVRIDGQAMWEGMFYFGLDDEGFISSHVFDRKVSNLRPFEKLQAVNLPWLRSSPTWTPDLVGAGSFSTVELNENDLQ